MSQANPTIGADPSGLQYREDDNAAKQALLSQHKGGTAPSYATAGTIWLDDAATPWLLKLYDGADWITFAAVNPTTNAISVYHGTAALRYLNHAPDTGEADAYAIAPSPAITAYVAGMVLTLKPANANTGACTIDVNGLGTVAIKLQDGSNPYAGALATTGVYTLFYDGTNAVLLNPSLNPLFNLKADASSLGSSAGADLINDPTMATATESNVSSSSAIKSYVDLFTKSSFGLVVTYGSSQQVNISSGTTISDDGTMIMRLPTDFTKTVDADFATGTGNGARDAALSSNSMFYVFLIGNPTTGATDILVSNSLTAPTLPSGFTKKRVIRSIHYITYINSFLTIGKNITNYLFTSSTPDINEVIVGTTRTDHALVRAPANALLYMNATLVHAGGTAFVHFTNPDITDNTPTVGGAMAVLKKEHTGTSVSGAVAGSVIIATSASGQISLRADRASCTVSARIMGFVDPNVPM